jgi:hypothetical protein
VSAFAAADWTLWNARVLAVFGPVLLPTGIAGFSIPARFALMSGAPGLTGWFPARPFRYKPADHVVHAVIGVGLAGVGWMGLR